MIVLCSGGCLLGRNCVREGGVKEGVLLRRVLCWGDVLLGADLC